MVGAMNLECAVGWTEGGWRAVKRGSIGGESPGFALDANVVRDGDDGHPTGVEKGARAVGKPLFFLRGSNGRPSQMGSRRARTEQTTVRCPMKRQLRRPCEAS